MGRQFITYWKTEEDRLAFYNRLDVLRGLGCEPVESIPFDEFFPIDDSSNGERWKAIKTACRHFDKNYELHDGSYFACTDKYGTEMHWTFVTVSENSIKNIAHIEEQHIPKFKLKNSGLWCVQCTMEPEQVNNDDEYNDDDIFI